ncbi:MAG: glycosyltransferase family 39 protein, partial [Bacteroidales bacterium]|nr:glycosyltransferase family 39 protein [Bacteroidales bacterium]
MKISSIKNFPKDSKKTSQLIVLVFMLINLVFKLFNISYTSFYLDEANQVFMSLQTIKEIYLESLQFPNGPLYTILFGGWIKIFGISEFSGRLFSVLASVLTVPAIFYLVKKHFQIRVAIAAVAIFTLSNWQYYYAHEARSYTLISLLVVLSFNSFFNYFIAFRKIHLLWYILLTTVLFYIHLTSVFILSVQGIISLFYIRKHVAKVILLWLAMFIPVILLSLWLINNSWFGGRETVWMEAPQFQDLINMFSQYFNHKYIFYAFLTLIVVYLVKAILNREYDKKFWGMFLWGVLPVIAIFFVSIYYNPRFTYRYMLYATIGLYISYAILLAKVFKSNYIFYLLLLATLAIQAIHINPKLKADGDWRSAVNYYKSVKKDNSATIIAAAYLNVPFAYYYDKDIFKDYRNLYQNLLDE